MGTALQALADKNPVQANASFTKAAEAGNADLQGPYVLRWDWRRNRSCPSRLLVTEGSRPGSLSTVSVGRGWPIGHDAATRSSQISRHQE